ncbi:hypothetical protein KY285_005571 [Solanum tuberosum]|nr:hypothetical protein KY285_005571 [Solanum tuberosum]
MGRHVRTRNNFNTLEEGEYLNVGEIGQGSEDRRGGNVRGLNKVYKHKELKMFLQENKVGVITITETRVKENNAAQVVMKIAKNWIWHNNYVEDQRGRIWILWNPKMVEFQLRDTHASDSWNSEEAGENTGPKPFRFFNYLADHPEFMQAVENNWKSQRQASTMNEVWRKIKGLKYPMRGLSNHDFQGIQSRVTKVRTQLKKLQEQMRYVQDDNLVEQYQMEKSLKTQLEK